MPKPMWTTQQICDHLQIDRKTLGRWLALGKFPPPIRIGRQARWPAETIEAFLAGHLANVTP